MESDPLAQPEVDLLEDLQALLDRGFVQLDPASQDDRVRVALTARGRHEVTPATPPPRTFASRRSALRLVDTQRTDRSE